MTQGVSNVTVTVTAENQFTEALEVDGQHDFNISVSGTITGSTITLQRSYDEGSTWHDVDSWTAAFEGVASDPEKGVYYRLGIKTGDFGIGDNVICRLGY